DRLPGYRCDQDAGWRSSWWLLLDSGTQAGACLLEGDKPRQLLDATKPAADMRVRCKVHIAFRGARGIAVQGDIGDAGLHRAGLPGCDTALPGPRGVVGGPDEDRGGLRVP